MQWWESGCGCGCGGCERTVAKGPVNEPRRLGGLQEPPVGAAAAKDEGGVRVVDAVGRCDGTCREGRNGRLKLRKRLLRELGAVVGTSRLR